MLANAKYVIWMDGEETFQRKPQPRHWNAAICARDGSDSGASVKVFRSTVAQLGIIIQPLYREEYQQQPNADTVEYGLTEDEYLMSAEHVNKELLIVVQRSNGVDVLERQTPPYSNKYDPRAWTGNMSWTQIRKSTTDHFEAECEPSSLQLMRLEAHGTSDNFKDYVDRIVTGQADNTLRKFFNLIDAHHDKHPNLIPNHHQTPKPEPSLNSKSMDPKKTSASTDPLEEAEAKKEKGSAPQDEMKGEEALNEAIGDDGGDEVDVEETTEGDDPLEKAAATKEKK
ncbi:MAG: hypothetical protein Q9227_000192 [Pyrenula ochraceoflavens]